MAAGGAGGGRGAPAGAPAAAVGLWVRCGGGGGAPRQLQLRLRGAAAGGAEGAGGATVVAVGGLPPGAGAEALRALCEGFGEVEAVEARGGRGAVAFRDAEAALEAVAAAGGVELPLEAAEEGEGVRAWVGRHRARRPGHQKLQEQLDAWMEAWEAEEARKRREREEAAGGDGWTVVGGTKGRKKTRDDRGTAVGGVSAALAESRRGKGQKKPEENFYRFQRREKRRDEVLELRQRFEEDRKRLAAMRKDRQFKPY